MMVRLHPLFFGICLVFIGATASAQPDGGRDARALAHLDGEALAIAQWVIGCQRAGWEDFNIETYLSQFADDATVVLGRYGEPGEYDVTYNYDTIVATRTMRMRGENPGIVLGYVDVAVEIDGDAAVMTTRTLAGSHDSDYREIMNERFTLRRDGDGWLVVEDRGWLVGELVDGERQSFDAAMWRHMDELIEEEQQGDHDKRWLRDFMVRAYRHHDAHQMAIAVCEAPDANAQDWALRGLFAVIVGDVDDAEAAFAMASDLDPGGWLPYYARPEEDDR